MRSIFDCRDGYVLLLVLGGTMVAIGEYKLVEWPEAGSNGTPDILDN